MSKNAAASATPPAETAGMKTVVLVKEHKDAGQLCAPGTELTLPAAIADWLVAVGTAEHKQ